MLRNGLGGGLKRRLWKDQRWASEGAIGGESTRSAAALGEPMTAQTRGRFITLEGGEGAGKSVQAKRLEERLCALGLAIVRTREPGGSPGAEALREAILSGFAGEFNPISQAVLFSAARVDHLHK